MKYSLSLCPCGGDIDDFCLDKIVDYRNGVPGGLSEPEEYHWLAYRFLVFASMHLFRAFFTPKTLRS
jgi:hypothetical protein